jgi:hypothetical protein
MPSDESGLELKWFVINRQHCTLGPVPAGKNSQCSVTFMDSIGNPNHAVKGSTTYLPNAKGRAATISAVAAATTTDDGDDDDAAAAAPRVSLSPAPVQLMWLSGRPMLLVAEVRGSIPAKHRGWSRR